MSEEQRENLMDVIRRELEVYATCKAERIKLEHTRKSVKAVQMKKAEQAGHKTTSAQEREAYASEEYRLHIEGLAYAVEQEEKSRYMLTLAQMKFDKWKADRWASAQEMRNYGG
jgi:hypothetical protein